MRARRSVAACLILGLGAAACSSGHQHRRAERPVRTPDACTLVSRDAIAAILGLRNAQEVEVTPGVSFFSGQPMTGQRDCLFDAASDHFNTLDMVVAPDQGGVLLRRRRDRMRAADTSSPSLLTYPRGLGPDAVQVEGLIWCYKNGFDLGVARRGSDDPAEAEKARTLALQAYQQL